MVLRRTPAQRRRMLMVALPLSVVGGIVFVAGLAIRGAGVLVVPGLVLLFAPLVLVLDQGWVEVRLRPEGFTIRRAGSSLTCTWDEVDHFYLRTVRDLVRGSGKVVTVSFRESRPTFPVNRRALAGYISSVGMDPDAELELLETWRRRWTRSEV